MTLPAPRFDNQAKAAFIVACLTLLACSIAFQGAVQALNVYLRKEPVQMRRPFTTISTTLGQWKALGKDGTLDTAMIEELGTDKFLDRVYAVQGDPALGVLNVHLDYYTGMIDTVPHVPDRCMVAAGYNAKTLPANLPLALDRSAWEPDPQGAVNRASGQTYWTTKGYDGNGNAQIVRMPVGDLKLRTVRFERDGSPEQAVFGGYFFIANGRATATPEGVKALAFDPSEKYAYYCKVQFIYASRDATQESFLALVGDILKDLLPEVMQRLPDWSEIEQRSTSRKVNKST